VALGLLLLGLVVSQSEDELYQSFQDWMVKYSKSYDGKEMSYRYYNFKNSINRINANNAKIQGSGATFGLNKFSDLSPEEFAGQYLMQPIPLDMPGKREVLTPKLTAPDTFDWRDHNVVTAVKDQEACGSCWAFSVTENVESVWILAHASTLNSTTMPPLAPQQLVDCDDYSFGCNGGFPPLAYDYLVDAGGFDDDKDYPYLAQDGTCAFKTSAIVAKITGYKFGTDPLDESMMKDNLVSWAPFSICVDARYWSDYTGGVMAEWQCDDAPLLDHCVQLVGFNMTASTPYWIVRNSWGTDWGEDGFIRLEYGTNTCGLTYVVTTAIA